jgi:hypothetical protein
MTSGVQFRGTVNGNQSARWFTYNWPPSEQVVWTVVPDIVNTSAPQIDWSVAVQRASSTAVTYWITVTNLTSGPVDIEARYVTLP